MNDGTGSPSTGLPSAVLVPAGNWLFRTRNWVFPAVFLATLILFPVRPMSGGATAEILRHAVGIGLVLLGAALRAATIGLVVVKRGGSGGRIHADRLYTHGMFAHCRNPLYVGNLLIVAGIVVNQNNPWAGLLLGAFFLFAYRAMVAAEETYLDRRFGDPYRRYRHEVPRWRIRLAGLAATFRGYRFEWRRVIFVEYPSLALWAVIVLAQLGAASAATYGVHESRYALAAVALGILAAGAAAFYVRFLKRTGRLRRPT